MDHVDPGNIWSYIQAAINRNPNSGNVGWGGGSGGSGNPVYCDDDNEDDDGSEDPKAGDLISYIKAWAWPDYRKNFKEPTQAYAEYMKQSGIYKGACNGIDCGAFVANIIKASGWDTNYVQGGTSEQKKWLPANWELVDESSLKLGDVGVKKTGHHVILYVGNISGFNSVTASASQCDRAPMAGSPNENLSNYNWYRKP